MFVCQRGRVFAKALHSLASVAREGERVRSASFKSPIPPSRLLMSKEVRSKLVVGVCVSVLCCTWVSGVI